MNNGAKFWLKAQFTRLELLSLRERCFFFLILIVCFLAIFHVFGLAPAKNAHYTAVSLLEKQELELQKARIDSKSNSFSVGNDSLAGVELEKLQNSIKAARQLMLGFSAASSSAPPLPEVLVHLLRRQDKLKLLQLATLTDITQASKEVVGTLPAGLTLQGLELTVIGTYPELTRYVAILEQELKGIRWGTMKLKSEKLPPELTMQIFLVVINP